ncbi:uncharacterized protein nrm isoform X6 [Drosophila bipectinata]|uniref:uncharacterized protein nrm isoform X6 n=1 Tax=Drosophila bipectinata TaxID=42026 RepID=UPI0038B3FADF
MFLTPIWNGFLNRKTFLFQLSRLCDLIPFLVIFILAQPCVTNAQIDRTVSELETKSVILTCPVNEAKCGKLHSLNWFKGEDRIAAMLLGETNVMNVNEKYQNRVTVVLNPYRLIINDLQIGDEDIYLCDTTFFIPEESCDNFNGYRIELRVLVPPSEVIILDAKGDRIENGNTVGPMQERQSLKATCTVKNTRPQPEVGWFRGSKRLTTYSPTHDIKDGLFTSTLELDWSLSREDLAQEIECRVKSAAMPETIVKKFSINLQVRPTSIEMNGVEHHTVQGSKVILTCDIHGARPPVNLTWYNVTTPITTEENILTEIRTKAFEKNDGTYHTQSELIFNATRFENDRVFRCEAENIVIQINREKPISSALTLEVLYPPVVKVSPPEVVTNTSEIVLLNCEYVANPASLTNVVWYRNNEVVNVNNTDRYQGGNSENVALVIKSTEKDDTGNYSCQLSNSIGKGVSEQEINLDVQYVPIVEVVMIPEGPVKESDESNVTLFCNIIGANPSLLTKVRWYANSTLLKELPDCEETNEDLCHIDPSKLLLESIGRGFFYNYSCEGLNAAGWGPRSEDKELMVHYEPGPASLSNFPLIAVKKKSVVLTCSVDDPGYPDSNRFVTTQAVQNNNKKAISYPILITYHTVKALKSNEADIALESFLLQKMPQKLSTPSENSSQTILSSESSPFNEIKETHALIDFNYNNSPCTLLTLTTYTKKLQLVVLYTGLQSNLVSSTYALYRKMGKFTFNAQMISKPNRYRWLRGGRGPLQDVVTKDWTVEPVGLDSRTNYSCYAYNEGGRGIMATVNLKVHAPPFFIKNLPPYTGILHSSTNANLTCRIECVPRCEISWLKGGIPIEKNNTKYFVKEKYMESSPATGDFESMLSVLHFNMSNWPQQKFDIEADNDNYTCLSTSNSVGPSVKSSTYFSIEYSPINTTVSEENVYIEEDTKPERIFCNARANPEPSYKWIFKNETIANGNFLTFDFGLRRNQNGIYSCMAYNKHGNDLAHTVITVQFKPDCNIKRENINGQDTLVCTAFGKPSEADFSWSIKGENETIENLGSGYPNDLSDKSFYVLKADYGITRTYRCLANNTVGSGTFCEIEVDEQLAWWQRWEENTLVILLTGILVLLLIVVIICCIIIYVCRRRRRQDKYLSEAPLTGNQSVLTSQPDLAKLRDSLPIVNTTAEVTNSMLIQKKWKNYQNSTGVSNISESQSTCRDTNSHKSPPRWPLRPGVLLHVNNETKENLVVNRTTIKQDSYKNNQFENCAAELNPMLVTPPTKSCNNKFLSKIFSWSKKRVPRETNQNLTPNSENANLASTDIGVSSIYVGNINSNSATSSSSSDHILERIIFYIKRPKRPSRIYTRDSQRSQVCLLRTIWRGHSYDETSSKFRDHHRFKGIRCSGIVTFKKKKENTEFSHNCTQETASVKSNTMQSTFMLLQEKTRYDTTSIPTKGIQSMEGPSVQLFTDVPRSIALENLSCTPLKGTCADISSMDHSSSLTPTKTKKLIHDKSSSMGEPLTEPCEYENLPFHGLQTAPNKLYNTPTSLNNNVNVICGGSQSKKVNKDYNPVLNSDPHLQKKTPLGQPISPSTFSVECTASKGPRQGKSQNVSNFSLEPNLNLQICVSKINTSNATKNHHHQEFGNTLNVKTKKLNNKSSKLYSSIDKVHNHPTDVKKIPLETSVSSNNPCHAANSVHKYDNGIQNIREKTNKSNFNVEKEFQLLKSSEEIQFKTKYVGDSKTCFTESLSVEGVGILPKCQKHYPFMSNRNGNIYSSRQSIHLHDLHCGNLGEKRLENPDECVSGIGIQKNIKYMGNAHLHSNSKEKKYIYPKKLSPEIKCGAVETDANLQFLKPESYMIYRSDSGISNSSQESQMQPSLPPLRRSKYTKIQLENSPTSYKNRKIVHKPECGKSHHQNYLDEIGSKGFGNKDFDSISSPEKNNPKQFERPSKNSKEENYYHQKKITRQSATPVFKFWKETNFVNPNGQLNCKVSGTLVESRQHRNTIPHQNEPLNATSFEDEFIYADLESQHYGPINYKAASLYAKVKKNKITGVLDENK